MSSLIRKYWEYENVKITWMDFFPVPSGLAGPEGALGLLLERALGIREEVVASLQSTQGSIQVEALSRRLLENHIHTITHIVQQLSTNMQVALRVCVCVCVCVFVFVCVCFLCARTWVHGRMCLHICMHACCK